LWNLPRGIIRAHVLRGGVPCHHSSSSTLRRLPIPINASRPSPRTIMRIMNHPINHRRKVFRHAHNQSPRRQLIRPQMHRTSRPNLHGRCPNPPQRFHYPLDRTPVNPSPRITNPPFPRPSPLMHSSPVHPLINLLILPPGSNRNGPYNTIPSRPPIPSCRPSPIIKSKMFSRAPQTQTHSSWRNPPRRKNKIPREAHAASFN